MKNNSKLTKFTTLFQAISQRVSTMTTRVWMIVGATCIVIIGAALWLTHDREPTLQERYPDLEGRDLNAMLIREKTQKAAEMVVIDPSSLPASATSPLTIRGQALGSWFSKGGFPVELHDKNGYVIATAQAVAAIEGSKKSFIPFSVTLHFAPQESGTPGKVVIKNAYVGDDSEQALEHNVGITF